MWFMNEKVCIICYFQQIWQYSRLFFYKTCIMTKFKMAARGEKSTNMSNKVASLLMIWICPLKHTSWMFFGGRIFRHNAQMELIKDTHAVRQQLTTSYYILHWWTIIKSVFSFEFFFLKNNRQNEIHLQPN